MNKLKIYIPSENLSEQDFEAFVDTLNADCDMHHLPEFFTFHIKERVKIARDLVLRLKDKTKDTILITSDDMIIRELNNLIMLNNVGEEGFNKIKDKPCLKGVEYNMRLNYKQVEAYYIFKNGKLEKIEVDNTGVRAETLNEIIENQNEAQGELWWAGL